MVAHGGDSRDVVLGEIKRGAGMTHIQLVLVEEGSTVLVPYEECVFEEVPDGTLVYWNGRMTRRWFVSDSIEDIMAMIRMCDDG